MNTTTILTQGAFLTLISFLMLFRHFMNLCHGNNCSSATKSRASLPAMLRPAPVPVPPASSGG